MTAFIIVFLVVVVLFLFSQRTTPSERWDVPSHDARRQREREIVQNKLEAEEAPRRRNNAQMWNDLSALNSRPALDYGNSDPQLGDGDVIDAEVTDVAGLLGGGG